MKKLTGIDELKGIILEEERNLSQVVDYLSESGLAKREALIAAYWHLSFCDSLETFWSLGGYKDLTSIEGKHQSYYKALQEINRAVQASIAGEKLNK